MKQLVYKDFCYVLGLVLCSTTTWAQHIRFDGDGRVVEAPGSVPSIPSNLTSLISEKDSASLNKWNEETIAAAKKELLLGVQSAIRTLKSPTTSDYYNWLWKDSGNKDGADELLRQLAEIETQLASANGSNTLDSKATYFPLAQLIANNLSTSSKYFALRLGPDEPSEVQVKLLKTSANKEFLIAYFETLVKESENNLITTLTKERFQDMLLDAAARQKPLSKFIAATTASAAKKQSGNSLIDLLNSVYDEHEKVKTAPLIKVMSTPWMKAWLWHSSGNLQLNPLPFTDPAFLRESPEFDPKKEDFYNQYVNRTLTKRIASDKTFDISSFVADAKKLGKAKQHLTDPTNYKQAAAANAAAAKQFQLTEITANLVSIPLKKDNLKYITYTQSRKDDLAAPQKLPPQPVDTRVVVTVHNLEKNETFKLIRKKAVAIKDESATQKAVNDGLDSFSTLDVALSALGIKGFAPLTIKTPAVQLTPLAGANFDKKGGAAAVTSTRRNYSLQELKAGVKDQIERLKLSEADEYRFVRLLPEADQGLNQDIFDSLFQKVPSLTKLTPEQFGELLIRLRDNYLSAYAAHATPAVINALAKDRTYLATSIALANDFTLPPKRIERKTDPQAQRHSERGITLQSDSTLSSTYALQKVTTKEATKEKETIDFGLLTYKTGKFHRVQFSAGLAYTAASVNSPELKESNGQITYSGSDIRYRVYAGLHFYPFGRGLFLQDESFVGKSGSRLNRVYFLAGVGIPKPLDNFYFGLGYDFGPGIRLSTGLHLHGFTHYEVANNRIVEESQRYRPVFPFFALGIDPVSFVKAFNIFK